MDKPGTADLHALYLARLAHVRQTMRREQVPALLSADPINIQYITGSSNMTVFGLYSCARYLLLFAEGPAILFEFSQCEHLSAGLPTIDEIRSAVGLSHVAAGPGFEDTARTWAREMAALVDQHVGRGALLAVERLPFLATDALRSEGLRLIDAGPVLSAARSIKLPIEIPVIREAVARVEAAVADMHAALQPGVRESAAWSRFHQGLIAREGEYVVTRLMQSGPRTFPYFQECGNRVINDGDLVCLYTDATGYLGYCVDFSRSFLCGSQRPSPRQRRLYQLALDQLDWNIELFHPRHSYRDIAEKAWTIPEAHRPTSYYCIGHGLGMSGEFPNIPHLQPGTPYPLAGGPRPGMVICAESYIGDPEGGEGVKLEDQLLITEAGAERLSTYRFEDAFLSRQF